jgi:hypothetical protein
MSNNYNTLMKYFLKKALQLKYKKYTSFLQLYMHNSKNLPFVEEKAVSGVHSVVLLKILKIVNRNSNILHNII